MYISLPRRGKKSVAEKTQAWYIAKKTSASMKGGYIIINNNNMGV